MKSAFFFIVLILGLQSLAFGKVVMVDDRVYIRKDGRQIPVFLVNELIEKRRVKKVNLFGEGKAHLISFAIKGESEKLYSIDDQGFIYAIEPYSKYNVNKVTDSGDFAFREMPGKMFKVTDKGFFIH